MSHTQPPFGKKKICQDFEINFRNMFFIFFFLFDKKLAITTKTRQPLLVVMLVFLQTVFLSELDRKVNK